MTRAAAALALSLLAGPALAQGSSPWQVDLAFGLKGVSDYNFRGISQTARGAAIQGFVEPRFGPFYVGAWASNVTLPTNPGAEIDLYGGVRLPVGPVTLDLGAMYYHYPNERQFQFPVGTILTPRDTDFWEVYFRPTWALNETLTLGVNLAYAPNWLNSGSTALFSTVTARVNLPENFSISGELGRYAFGTTAAWLGGVRLPDYTLWNVGVSYTWDSLVTFDLRYHGTSLSPTECFTLTTDPRGVFTGSNRSSWCGTAFIASISFETTWSDLQKRTAPRR